MEPLHAPTAMTHFLRLIHACPNTQAVTALVRSIYSWLSYYPYLHTVVGGFGATVAGVIGEPWYALATVVLNGVAVTFYAVFGLPVPVTTRVHSHLTGEFPHLCVVYRLQGATADLAAQMRDLDARIIARRVDESQRLTASPRDTVLDLLLRLDQYIVAMIALWETNLEQSVFGSRPPPQET
jgi:hypothetical protein